MTWINKTQRQPYSYKNDDTILDKKKATKRQLSKIQESAIVWFKDSKDNVFQSTLDEVTKNKIDWEWWQPCNRLYGQGYVLNMSSAAEMVAQKKNW